MANEKRLIDANALEAVFMKTKMIAVFPNWRNMDMLAKCAVVEYAKRVKDIVTNAPTVDAVEVVRCKDCKHRYNGKDCTHPLLLSYSWGAIRKLKDNDFCSYGERRTDGETERT